MKIEIEKSEYKRLKSREEKLMAYYEWFVDKENDLATVEDIVNKNIELEEEKQKLKEENEKLNLHIEAKDEAYMKLLKDYEKIKDDREYMKEKLENDLGKMLFYVNQNF